MHVGVIRRIADPEGFGQAEEAPLGFLMGSRCQFMPAASGSERGSH